jgi:hypothetical protein
MVGGMTVKNVKASPIPVTPTPKPKKVTMPVQAAQSVAAGSQFLLPQPKTITTTVS